MIRFVDREEELKLLEQKFRENKPNFILIYGRRRIGKTELIKQFIRGKNAFYFLAKKQDLNLEFERFLSKFCKTFKVYIEARNWEDLFREISRLYGEKLIIVIDEFSYWVEKDQAICSEFQLIWDEILKKTNIFLILCGSLVGTMESLLSYKNPLYGRRTIEIKLKPLKFFDIKGFLPSYSIEELVKVYACTSGIPEYLLKFDDELSFEENLNRNFFSKGILYEDAEKVLKDELREPTIYLNIIQKIGEGCTKLTEIASKTRIQITNLPKYLKVLKSLEIVKKETPLTIKKRKGLLKVEDFYFNFWLKFVEPYREEIELGIYDFNARKTEFNRYLGEVFEEIAKEFLILLGKRFKFKIQRIGKWWYRDKEIDILALNEENKEIAFFEVKWKEIDAKESKRIVKELMEVSKSVEWKMGERKEYFGIIAKGIKNKRELRSAGILAYDLTDFGEI